jgi:TRAP-type C4-dicarboxylate transport system permease small subunit
LNRSKRILKEISAITEKITEIAVIPITLIFLVLVFLAVLTRFIFKVPIVASLEYSRIAFVWFCFLGSTLAYKKKEHIQFSFLLSRLPEKVLQSVKVFNDILGVIFFAVLLYQSIKLNIKVSTTVFPASGLSYNTMYASLSVAALFGIVHALYFVESDMEQLLRRAEKE